MTEIIHLQHHFNAVLSRLIDMVNTPHRRCRITREARDRLSWRLRRNLPPIRKTKDPRSWIPPLKINFVSTYSSPSVFILKFRVHMFNGFWDSSRQAGVPVAPINAHHLTSSLPLSLFAHVKWRFYPVVFNGLEWWSVSIFEVTVQILCIDKSCTF